MVLGMMSFAFAADDFTLTINNTVADHTYTAYQIFKGSKADKTQVSYGAATGYVEGTQYYELKGADYEPIAITSAEAYGSATATKTLYVRNGNNSLGDTVWGADITDAGKQALYEEYSITVESGHLDDTANILALIDAIADVDNKNKSESDKAVRFANVFYTTAADGSVTAKDGLLTGPTGGSAIKATGTSVTFSNLASGYYLVNDTYTPKDGEELGVDYSIARIAVQVVGNTTINNKADKVVAEKKIKTAAELINEKANELGIGRKVEYEVTEYVPNYDGYEYYYFDMRDTMSKGLTFDPDSVVVTIGNTTLTKGTDYYVYSDKTADAAVLNGATFVLAFEDIMDYAVGSTIVVNYAASVNSEAITGVDPNTNKVHAEYSNDPDKSERGDGDHHGIPANTTDHPMGTTPDTFTDTYTTKLTIHKQDGTTKEKLANVEFTLTGTSKDVVVKTETVYELDPTGTFYMLNDGTYTEEAPTTKPSLQATTDNSGWIEIGASESYTGSDVRTVDGKKYRPFVVATDSGKDHYVIVEPNDADYASTTLLYKPVVKSTTADTVDTYNVARTGLTDANGNLDFSQLGAGTYTLSETKVLPGYNDIADITFTVACSLPEQDTVTAGTEKATWSVTVTEPAGTAITQVGDTGVFEVTIENNKGTELPSTGGIGTTIFYLIGAALVLGAGVLLVTKRKMAVK